MALRKKLITDIYLGGFSTNVSISATAEEAVQHGLRVSVIEDCLGYRSEKAHKEAMARMVEFLGVDKIDSEGIKKDYEGLSVPDTEDPFNEMCLSTNEDIIGGTNSDDAKAENVPGQGEVYLYR